MNRCLVFGGVGDGEDSFPCGASKLGGIVWRDSDRGEWEGEFVGQINNSECPHLSFPQHGTMSLFQVDADRRDLRLRGRGDARAGEAEHERHQDHQYAD